MTYTFGGCPELERIDVRIAENPEGRFQELIEEYCEMIHRRSPFDPEGGKGESRKLRSITVQCNDNVHSQVQRFAKELRAHPVIRPHVEGGFEVLVSLM